ncbi:hypothetical protein SEA_PAPAYASALAD_51 [Streptomyces phage PapayaSalad]|uniref:Helix-turn-helix DNA binding domain protein n=1 Tax=Streptomyces phage PapayaSalad TaxID=1920310 RepID=A0A1J0MCQ6_9CAUD|nr:hypothetical protein HOR44_gp30 [Streptomyces phage PapayaSalad]APD18630.1 hypothetical protein SEA_PAPAYASALAD_51 [Streptomyces phage PapayaSalad]
MKFNITIETGPTPEYDTMNERTVVRLIRQAHVQGFTIHADARNYTITLVNGQRTVRVIPARRPPLPTDRQRNEMHRMIVLGRELTWARSSRNVGILTDGQLKMSHQLSDGLLERGYVTGTGHAGSEGRRTLVACLAFARTAKHESWEARDEILRRAVLDIAETSTVAWRETLDPTDTEPATEQPATEQPAAVEPAKNDDPLDIASGHDPLGVANLLDKAADALADRSRQQRTRRRVAQPDADKPKTAPATPVESAADDLNHQHAPRFTGQPSKRLMAQMIDLFGQWEREAAAERARQGDTNPYDLDEWEQFEDIADQWTNTEGDEQAREAFLDRLADLLTLDNLRVLRMAAEAAAAVTPRVVRAERARYKVLEIAARSGLTEGRIYQILRDN